MASRFLVMSLATVIQLVVADLPANYTALSGLAKRGLLLDLVSQSSYLRQLPTAEPQSLTALFNPNSLVTLFTTQSDEWPNSDHEKLIHTYGGESHFVISRIVWQAKSRLGSGPHTKRDIWG